MTRIEEYALLGDLQSGVLVHQSGSIDWCCFPRFDSAACFAAILGGPEHGHWSLSPVDPTLQTTRLYRIGTLILETLHETPTGTVRVIDFMPPRDHAPDIVRIVEGVSGHVPMRMEFIARFDYGRIVPWVRRVDNARVAVAGPDALCLWSPVDVQGQNLTSVAELTVCEGDRLPFVLTWFPSHEGLPRVIDAVDALAGTESYWREWIARCRHDGEFHEEIHQSLLILKALTYHPTGGIVAAPTTSLPEWLGGVRNWDYRYCWLRDASLTLAAMVRSGYSEEAQAWHDWLVRAIAGSPEDVQIMYGIAGERRLEERTLEWLPGFADSQPVRVGNAASTQLQLDVVGEVADAMCLVLQHGGHISHFAWAVLRQLITWLEGAWREQDAGIWEVRGPLRHFTHSKVMAWVAFDRGVRMVEEFGCEGPADRWRAVCDEIHETVMAKGWNEDRGAFTQSFGADALDASVLLIPIVGFLPATDPRVVSTVEVIQRELMEDGLVQRYIADEASQDGLPAGEGSFLACSFWLVEALALQGREDEARALYQRLLGLRNDLGLLAEEYDCASGQMLGNFPQAFTHLALVNAALTLETHSVR